MLTPFAYAANSPIKFVDLDGKEMYVVGTGADEYVNMTANVTGLLLNRDPVSGLLSYASTAPLKGGPTGPGITQQVPVVKVTNNFQSANLRDEVIKTIDGGAQNGTKLAPVTINASSNQIPGVRFDKFRTNEVDMADFRAAKNYPEFQAAMIGHIINERNNPINLTNKPIGKRESISHAGALKFEGNIMREYDPNATDRNDNTKSTNKFFGRQFDASSMGGDLNDYTSKQYLNIIPNNSTIVDPNDIQNMVQVK